MTPLRFTQTFSVDISAVSEPNSLKPNQFYLQLQMVISQLNRQIILLLKRPLMPELNFPFNSFLAISFSRDIPITDFGIYYIICLPVRGRAHTTCKSNGTGKWFTRNRTNDINFKINIWNIRLNQRWCFEKCNGAHNKGHWIFLIHLQMETECLSGKF